MTYARNGLVARARMHIQQTPMIRLADVATSCGVSTAALRRAMRAETGVCLRDWQQAQGRSAAESMLMETASRSVKEVSGVLGFSSPQSFARWFRRQTGLSPSAFREQQAHLLGQGAPRNFRSRFGRPGQHSA